MRSTSGVLPLAMSDGIMGAYVAFRTWQGLHEFRKNRYGSHLKGETLSRTIEKVTRAKTGQLGRKRPGGSAQELIGRIRRGRPAWCRATITKAVCNNEVPSYLEVRSGKHGTNEGKTRRGGGSGHNLMMGAHGRSMMFKRWDRKERD
jgi:hypothetical protein